MGKLPAIIGVVLASVALVGSALANHAWGNYHWSRSSNPFTLQVGNIVSGNWGRYLSTAGNEWARSGVREALSRTEIDRRARSRDRVKTPNWSP